MKTRSFVLGFFVSIFALLGCSEVQTGDGYLESALTQENATVFTIQKKASSSLDTVQSNNGFRVKAKFAQVGSHVELIANAKDDLTEGARVQIQLLGPKKLRVLYGLQGGTMRQLDRDLTIESRELVFEISVYNEVDEVGLEVEETTQGLELLHAHIEEGRAQGKTVGVEYSNDGTNVESLAIKFNIPEHAHGETEESGVVASQKAPVHPELVQVETENEKETIEKARFQLESPRGDVRYSLLISLPEDGSSVTLVTNATEEREGGVSLSFERLGKRKVRLQYSLGGAAPRTVERAVEDADNLNLAVSVYSEPGEVGLDVVERQSKLHLLHAHLHGMAEGKSVFVVRREAAVKDLGIETDIPGHHHAH